jgi:hypothetical protein
MQFIEEIRAGRGGRELDRPLRRCSGSQAYPLQSKEDWVHDLPRLVDETWTH